VEEATIVDLQSAQQFRQLSASNLVRAYLSRINTYDKQGPNINSVLEINPDALEIAADLDRKRF
jgi:amidase